MWFSERKLSKKLNKFEYIKTSSHLDDFIAGSVKIPALIHSVQLLMGATTAFYITPNCKFSGFTTAFSENAQCERKKD